MSRFHCHGKYGEVLFVTKVPLLAHARDPSRQCILDLMANCMQHHVLKYISHFVASLEICLRTTMLLRRGECIQQHPLTSSPAYATPSRF